MPPSRLVDVGQASECDHDVEAVTITEDTGHRDTAGELFEVLGSWLVGHLIECDEGVSRRRETSSR